MTRIRESSFGNATCRSAGKNFPLVSFFLCCSAKSSINLKVKKQSAAHPCVGKRSEARHRVAVSYVTLGGDLKEQNNQTHFHCLRMREDEVRVPRNMREATLTPWRERHVALRAQFRRGKERKKRKNLAPSPKMFCSTYSIYDPHSIVFGFGGGIKQKRGLKDSAAEQRMCFRASLDEHGASARRRARMNINRMRGGGKKRELSEAQGHSASLKCCK